MCIGTLMPPLYTGKPNPYTDRYKHSHVHGDIIGKCVILGIPAKIPLKKKCRQKKCAAKGYEDFQRGIFFSYFFL